MRRIFVIVLFFVLWGCSPPSENESQSSNEPPKINVKSNEIEINGLIYNQNIIKGYLDLIVLDDNSFDNKDYHVAKNKLSYFVADSEDGKIVKAVDDYLRQISDLTGLKLSKQDKDSVVDAQYIWLHLSEPELILNYPYVVDLLQSGFKEIIESEFKVVTHKGMFIYDEILVARSHLARVKPDEPNFMIYQSRAGSNESGNQSSHFPLFVNRNYFKYDQQQNSIENYINKVIFPQIFKNLAPVNATISDVIRQTTIQHEIPISYDIHPFDKAFIKALYSHEFMLGESRHDFIEWLSAEIFRLIKSNEVR